MSRKRSKQGARASARALCGVIPLVLIAAAPQMGLAVPADGDRAYDRIDTGGGPVLSADLLYQDIYPSANTLLPAATAEIHCFYDINRSDGDPTNADLGDSAVVIIASDLPGIEAYLNFRVYPGPATDTNDPWFSSYGGDFIAGPASGPQDDWAEVRMDTSEVSTHVAEGSYASYDWPDGLEEGTKIIPDGVLTPGATVEYFFSARLVSALGEVWTAPDTTGGTYYELEILPGYFRSTGGEILAPCLLYVDAANDGGQGAIEEIALRNVLGDVVDENGLTHDAWDRYDYLSSSSNVPAPLARESNGNNGMTHYQSLVYRTIFYNTGSFSLEGLRDGDAALLIDFLADTNFNRSLYEKGLWLSGDGIGSILSRPGRPNSNELLAEYAAAAPGPPAAGVRLAPADGAVFGEGESYASVCRLGTPSSLLPVGPGVGNLIWVNDTTGEETAFASISNDQFAPGNVENWAAVTDAFSLQSMRSTPPDFEGSVCDADQNAMLVRTANVLGFLRTSLGPCVLPEVSDAGDGAPAASPAFTRLLPSAPNPFNPHTTIRYELASSARVMLEVFDVTGRRVRTLVDETREAGRHATAWDGAAEGAREAASGVYWVRLRTSQGFEGKTRVVLLK